MSSLYEPEDEYLPNIPKYIQDIVFIHNFRYALQDEELRHAFDWYVDEVSWLGYPQDETALVED